MNTHLINGRFKTREALSFSEALEMKHLSNTCELEKIQKVTRTNEINKPSVFLNAGRCQSLSLLKGRQTKIVHLQVRVSSLAREIREGEKLFKK